MSDYDYSLSKWDHEILEGIAEEVAEKEDHLRYLCGLKEEKMNVSALDIFAEAMTRGKKAYFKKKFEDNDKDIKRLKAHYQRSIKRLQDC